MIRLLLLTLVLWACTAHAQQLALTFDDGLDPAKQPQSAGWNAAILRGLREARVEAMVFPALVRMGGEPGLGLVREWAREGHAVGNHTASHRSLSSPRMDVAEFVADVERADRVLSGLPTFRPMLRFPYLKEGETAAKRDGIRAWMKSRGYSPAPVSIDTSDWYYDQVLREAGDDEAKAQAVKRAYIAHLLDRAAYYDGLALKVIGRHPIHVMLLHTSAINAQCLPELFSAFRERGWTFVSPLAAFGDPLYRMQPDVLPAGESIVWSLAKQVGVEGLRYPAEDAPYEMPKLRALGLVQ